MKTRRFLMLSYLTMKHAITFGSRWKEAELSCASAFRVGVPFGVSLPFLLVPTLT